MLLKSTENYLENAVRAKFMTFPTPFLSQNELELLEYIAMCVRNRCFRNGSAGSYELAHVILKFANFFKGRKQCLISTLQHFCIWLQFFMKDNSLTWWEFKIILIMLLQCKWFIKEDKVPLPGEQEGENEYMYGPRIKEMKRIRNQIIQNDPIKKMEIFGMHPTLYSDLKNAYYEGRKLLQYSMNARALNSVMTATRVSGGKEEFAITGTHSGKTHHNSDGLIRGFTKENGNKSVQPVYSKEENTLFHSHPSLSPISYNPKQDFYTQKIIPDGDIAHSYAGNKNIFAINNEGDIFYTNPKLAATCIDLSSACNADYGQIYLGNIREFIK